MNARNQIILLLAALCIQCAAGAVIEVGGPAGWIVQPYQNISANVGDVLSFVFKKGEHDVWSVPSFSCDVLRKAGSGAKELSEGPINVTLKEPGVQVYACKVSDHCEEGQIVAVTVKGGAPIVPVPGPSKVPTPAPTKTPSPAPGPAPKPVAPVAPLTPSPAVVPSPVPAPTPKPNVLPIKPPVPSPAAPSAANTVAFGAAGLVAFAMALLA